MRHPALRLCCIVFFALCLLLSATSSASAASTHMHTNASRQVASFNSAKLADFPTVDPDYIYDQLFSMVTQFQRRESGYDKNLPVNVNGHDEFANYWEQEMVRDLQGFGPQVVHDSFSVAGWRGRPATVPAFNVEVSVPGAEHPEQVVVIGCHYDGMAFSTQSANDDASGCAIELGVAKALGTYWRNHHVYPARTLRFVAFDAEEQGLFGSFHYLSSTVNGDSNNIVAMFNEEQNGIAYPLRYLGQMANPVLPFYVEMSPLQNSRLYPNQETLSATQRANITHFHALMQQAVPAVFAQFQAMGYVGLTYHGDNNQDVAQPIFTDDQQGNIHLEDDTLGSSDQVPFTLAGVPCATLVGNSTYYDSNPPKWSYPFDQQADTIQLMNTFADGSSRKSNALTLSLSLPGMFTTWMLNQPDILGQTSSEALPPGPLAAISDIGATQVSKSLTVNAKNSFDPKDTNASLSYTWNFGDGSQATGSEVSHTYTATGNYTLTLTASSATGTRRVSKTINVVTQSPQYNNPYSQFQSKGEPPSNPQVTLPTPNDTLSDKVLHTQAQLATAASTNGSTIAVPTILIALVAIVLLVLGGVGLLLWRGTRNGIKK